MCIIIDANVLADVFDETSQGHLEFKPVLDWVVFGKGKFVYGGSKYLKEANKYLGVFQEFRNKGKAVGVDNELVDLKQKWAASIIKHRNFDDEHIVGLLIASGCMLVCSKDKRAYPYFKNKAFFKSGTIPKIFSKRGNRDLLVDVNLAEICKPHIKLTNSKRKKLKV